LKIAVDLTPACARNGDLVTITVKTEPQATVAFQAIYSDGKSGASPYGAGYGGNTAGNADDQGTYINSWTLAKNPPPGPVRVDVYVFTKKPGHNNYGAGHFSVAKADGTCA
jgi:hypothetical protein